MSAIYNTSMLLIRREWQRLLNEPSRVFGVMLQPLVFLVVFGLGFQKSFHIDNTNYSGFFFPGILGLVVLFSSIYATLTLVEDKKCGFFRLVMVGPAGVKGALIGKVFATFTLGFCQSLLFLPLCFFLPLKHDFKTVVFALAFLIMGSFCFSLIGVLFAWISPSSAAFHALMSVILIPMWLMSGAMFPLPEGFFLGLSYINPMAYLVSGLRTAFLEQGAFLSNLMILAGFSLIFSQVLLALSFRRSE